MTRDEIKLVVFVLLALLGGAAVRHFRERNPEPGTAAPTPGPGGWAKPPYVFKDSKEIRKVAP